MLYSEAMSTPPGPCTSTFHGNVRWMAPELFEEQNNNLLVRPSASSDIYSFGSIMLHVRLWNDSPSTVIKFRLSGPYWQDSLLLLHKGCNRHSMHSRWRAA